MFGQTESNSPDTHSQYDVRPKTVWRVDIKALLQTSRISAHTLPGARNRGSGKDSLIGSSSTVGLLGLRTVLKLLEAHCRAWEGWMGRKLL